MIDTRYYTIVSNSTDMDSLLKQNAVFKKQNYFLTASLVLVALSLGIIILYNKYNLKHEIEKKSSSSF
jgi:hypothetical protein